MRVIQVSFANEKPKPENGFYWKDITDYNDDSDDPCYAFLETPMPKNHYLNELGELKNINLLCQDCGKEYFSDCECL